MTKYMQKCYGFKTQKKHKESVTQCCSRRQARKSNTELIGAAQICRDQSGVSECNKQTIKKKIKIKKQVFVSTRWVLKYKRDANSKIVKLKVINKFTVQNTKIHFHQHSNRIHLKQLQQLQYKINLIFIKWISKLHI